METLDLRQQYKHLYAPSAKKVVVDLIVYLRERPQAVSSK